MKALITICLLPLQIFAQDITGLWTGYIHTTDKTLPYELAISETNGKLTGYSHTTFTVNGVDEIGVKAVVIENKSGNVSVEDEALVFNDFTVAPVKGIRQYDFLTLIVKDNLMLLNGTFKTNKLRNYKSITGTIELRKIDTSQKTKIIPKLSELNLLNTLSFLQPNQKKEDIDIASANLEKVKGNISTNKETAIATSATINKSFPVLKSKQIEMPPMAQTEKEKSTESNLMPQQKDTALVVALADKGKLINLQQKQQGTAKVIAPEKEKKPIISPSKQKDSLLTTSADKEKKQIALQQKQQETAKVITPEKERKLEVISPPKQKETLVATSDKTGQEVIAQAKQKQIENTPAASIKPQLKPPPPEKPVGIISKPSVAKKDNKDTLAQIKNVVSASLPPAVKPAVVQVNAAAELDKRKTEKIQDVFFRSDSLVLSLYDNGEVDGDTVSVVLNGKVIIAGQGLTTNAITKTVYVTPDLGDSLQLVMYAENLGSIPPNTGLLILQDGKDRYEIRFAGDYQKNSAITLRRRR